MNRHEYDTMKRGFYRAMTITPAGKLGGVDWQQIEAAAVSLGRHGRACWVLAFDALNEMAEHDEATIFYNSLLRCTRAIRESYSRAA